MKLIITGRKGIGKSTLARRIYNEVLRADGDCRGFLTYRVEDGVQISGLDGSHCAWIADIKDSNPVAYTDAFEYNGVALIDEALKSDCKMIVMDELGFLERDAIEFQQAVFRVLKSDRDVVAVVKKHSCDFTTQIMEMATSLPDTRIIDLTEDICEGYGLF